MLLALETESTQLRRGNSDELCGYALLVHISEKQAVYSFLCLLRKSATAATQHIKLLLLHVLRVVGLELVSRIDFSERLH